jgi:hypothetical protein
MLSIRSARKFQFNSNELARVIADAAIATAKIGDGRLIPLVIFDALSRPDLAEFVRVHVDLGAGDVEAGWGRREGADESVILRLAFKRPIEVMAIFEFNIPLQGGLVDQIISVCGVYLQPGKDGDRLKTNLNVPKVYVEIPDTGFRRIWDDLWYRNVVKRMKSEGLKRQQAKRAATGFITEWRKFGGFRMGQP